MIARSLAILVFLLGTATAHADGCDALTAKLIRTTGASFAGRTGPLVVFRAADAERMSLICDPPHTMVFRSLYREPNRYYFVLIGLAGQALAGARAETVETLALGLHQATLLTGQPQQARAGSLTIRCEPGDRLDGLTEGTLCRIASDRPHALRRRAALSGQARAG